MGRAGMEKNMEVPEGTKSGSSVWFSSPTPRHRYTHGISEQDTKLREPRAPGLALGTEQTKQMSVQSEIENNL